MTNNAPKTEYRDPASLRLHKLYAHVPKPPEGTAEWHAFKDNLQAAGPDQIPAIFITAEGIVMDGSWRLAAAKDLQWDKILCMVQPEENAAIFMVDTLINRKQMTRGACIYFALGLLPQFVESSNNRRLNNLKIGRKTREVQLTAPKDKLADSLRVNFAAELCERWGVSTDTYQRAVTVRELFKANPELQKIMEPKLLSGEKNLWNIISGEAGKDARHQEHREAAVVESQLELFSGALDNLAAGGKTWKKLDEEKREEVIQKWVAAVNKWPIEMRQALLGALM